MSEILIKSAEFVKSVASARDLPRSDLTEIAFAGRSNSGKSTLINSLTMRRALAIASKTPGRTQLLNFFLLKLADNLNKDLQCHLVDLPGYGFAKVEGAKKKDWGKVIGEYLLTRDNLVILVLSHDIRRELQEEEFWFFEQFCNQPTQRKIVLLSLTKSDKLGASELSKRYKAIYSQLARISQAFPSRAGQESVEYESAQFLSGDGVLKHIEVDNNEQTLSLPAIGSRSRNKLAKCGLGPQIPDLAAQTTARVIEDRDNFIFVCGTDPRGKKGVESLRSAIFEILLNRAK